MELGLPPATARRQVQATKYEQTTDKLHHTTSAAHVAGGIAVAIRCMPLSSSLSITLICLLVFFLQCNMQQINAQIVT